KAREGLRVRTEFCVRDLSGVRLLNPRNRVSLAKCRLIFRLDRDRTRYRSTLDLRHPFLPRQTTKCPILC
ncbi:MAG TPA: hypothetical protein VH878_04525, partial [Thermodesulfobacteriota bacterium]